MQKQGIKRFLGIGLGQLPRTLAHVLSKIDTKEIVFIDIKKILTTLENSHAFTAACLNPSLSVKTKVVIFSARIRHEKANKPT